jgi:putative tricarboxylic transport membrane protein
MPTRHLVLALGFACALCGALAAHAQPAWKPSRPVEILVGVGPGGGIDRTARLLARVLTEKRLIETAASVINKPGGGGTLVQAYLNQHAGDGHYLEIGATSLLTNHITGRSPNNWDAFTPIAMLSDEYIGVAVRADSPLKDGRDLAALLKNDAGAIAAGIATSAGNTNHITLALVAKRAGGDAKRLKVVVFGSGGESTTALMGGHVGVVATPAATAAPQVQNGALRMLAVAAPRRLEGPLAGVPTWKELGFDIVVANWRPVIGPRGMSAEQVAYWEDRLLRFTQSDEWKRELADTGAVAHYLNSRELARYFAAQHAEFRAVLGEINLAK